MVGAGINGNTECSGERSFSPSDCFPEKHDGSSNRKMVKLLFFLSSFSIAAHCVAVPDSYDGGENYAIPRPYKMGAFKRITITRNGAWSDAVSGDETPEMCAKFQLQRSD